MPILNIKHTVTETIEVPDYPHYIETDISFVKIISDEKCLWINKQSKHIDLCIEIKSTSLAYLLPTKPLAKDEFDKHFKNTLQKLNKIKDE